jgi:hypothetical protein
MSVLNGYEPVAGHDELLLPRRRSPDRRWDSDFSYARYIESKERYGRLRPFSVYRYLDDFYARPGAVGFKLMYSQVKSYPEVLAYLRRRRVRVIHLVRRNHLDVLLSFAVKRAIGQAHVLEAEERPPDPTVELDPRTLVHDLKRLERHHALGRRVLQAFRLPHVEVSYEALAADDANFRPVLDFLGVPPNGALPASHILKSRRGTHRDVIANYDAVRSVLTGSKFAALLDE